MNKIRYFLYAALIVVGLMLWNAWNAEHPETPAASQDTQASAVTPSVTDEDNSVPIVNHGKVHLQATKISTQKAAPIPENRIIHIKTDVLNVDIDTLGGNVVSVSLPKYPIKPKSTKPYVLLNDSASNYFIAKSGLIVGNSSQSKLETIQFQSKQKTYQLENNQQQLIVTLTAKTNDGLIVKKQFTFKPDQYNFTVENQIKNITGNTWMGNYFMQFSQVVPKEKHSLFGLHLTNDVGFSSPDKPFQKINIKKLSDHPLRKNIKGGWLALIQHYFLGVWIPDSKVEYHYYSRVNANGVYTAGMMSPTIELKSGETTTINAKLYAGPKVSDRLSALAPHLALAVDYSSFAILSILASIIFWLLSHVNDIVGNWGWSIIIVTILIKLAFYHLSATSYRSMAGMRKLQTRITALKERYGDDKQGFSKAMMEMYKKEKINPLSGCLPILVQIPVFLALYWVLLGSVELRQAPFILWIHDLSAKDPYYILPVLMGISMYIQQKLSPAPADPTQAKVMMFLPVMFTLFFFNFPAGLVLYWLVNNVLSIAQQYYIMRKYDQGAYKKAKAKK